MEAFVAYLVNIATDINALSQQFSQEHSISFKAFQRAWKQMSFDHFFTGRRYDIECRDITEESLKAALNFCLPPHLVQTRIFGIYLVYALYNCHPFDSKVKVRILLQEWKDLLNFIDQVKYHIKTGRDALFMDCLTPGQAEDLPDVLAVFRQLRQRRAFVDVVTKSSLHPLMTQMLDSETEQRRSDYILNRASVVSKLFDVNAIDELSALMTEYDLQKEALCSNLPSEERSLKVTDGCLVQDVTRIVAGHLEWNKQKAHKKGRSRSQEANQSDVESESDVDQTSSRASPETSRRKSIGEKRNKIKSTAAKARPKAFDRLGRSSRVAATDGDAVATNDVVDSPAGRRNKGRNGRTAGRRPRSDEDREDAVVDRNNNKSGGDGVAGDVTANDVVDSELVMNLITDAAASDSDSSEEAVDVATPSRKTTERLTKKKPSKKRRRDDVGDLGSSDGAIEDRGDCFVVVEELVRRDERGVNNGRAAVSASGSKSKKRRIR